MGRVSWNLCILLLLVSVHSRAPHGACELKSKILFYCFFELLSRPAWGVWVEIVHVLQSIKQSVHVAPRMGRVSWNLILWGVMFLCYTTVAPRMGRVSWNYLNYIINDFHLCRAPHGACELKCKVDLDFYADVKSRPAWGVWVEIVVKVYIL